MSENATAIVYHFICVKIELDFSHTFLQEISKNNLFSRMKAGVEHDMVKNKALVSVGTLMNHMKYV